MDDRNGRVEEEESMRRMRWVTSLRGQRIQGIIKMGMKRMRK